MVTVLGGLPEEDPDAMARLAQMLGRGIARFVVQSVRGDGRSSPAALQEMLRANGYPRQEVIPVMGDDRPLVIGQRAND
jgi:hypothetical protein